MMTVVRKADCRCRLGHLHSRGLVCRSPSVGPSGAQLEASQQLGLEHFADDGTTLIVTGEPQFEVWGHHCHQAMPLLVGSAVDRGFPCLSTHHQCLLNQGLCWFPPSDWQRPWSGSQVGGEESHSHGRPAREHCPRQPPLRRRPSLAHSHALSSRPSSLYSMVSWRCWNCRWGTFDIFFIACETRRSTSAAPRLGRHLEIT